MNNKRAKELRRVARIIFNSGEQVPDLTEEMVYKNLKRRYTRNVQMGLSK